MSPRGAGAGDCACVRPVTGSTTISREQQVQDCAAALTPHAPQRPHPHTASSAPDALYFLRHRNPCGLPTVSLRCCLGLAADELKQGVHEEIDTFDSLLSFFFTNFSIDQSETLQILEKGTKFLL